MKLNYYSAGMKNNKMIIITKRSGDRTMKLLSVILLILFSINITGCVSMPRLTERENSDDTLVYGYVLLSNEGLPINLYLTDFSFKQIDPPTDAPYKSCEKYLGAVIFTIVKPGSYRIDSFKSFGGTRVGPIVGDPRYVNYKVPVQDNGFTIMKPGLFYFGAYEVNHSWSSGKVGYRIKKTYFASEEDVIIRILELTDKGTYWERALKYRLWQLRKWRNNNAKKKPLPAVD